MFPSSLRCLTVAILGALIAAAAAESQLLAQQPGTIEVAGSGKAAAVPQYVVIKGRIQASGDSGEAAAAEYRKLRTKLEKEFSGDDGPGAKLRFGGESPTQPTSQAAMVAAFGGGGAAPAAANPFSVTESVEMRVEFESDMERLQIAGKLGKVIDAATNAGVTFDQPMNQFTMAFGNQPQSFALYMLRDETAASIRQKAYLAAVKDARNRAELLAELAGGRLGKVVSIEEVDPQSSENPYAAMMTWSIRQAGVDEAPEVSSNRNSAIEVRRDLRVVFELVD